MREKRGNKVGKLKKKKGIMVMETKSKEPVLEKGKELAPVKVNDR